MSLPQPVPSDWSYAAAPEARDIVHLEERYGLYVGGEWVTPSETYTTIDPSREEPLAEVGQASPDEVRRAWLGSRTQRIDRSVDAAGASSQPHNPTYWNNWGANSLR